MKIFLDTNLILDVLAERIPFYENSRRIWEFVEKKDLTGYLSATTITDIFYIVNKQLGNEKAYETIGKILTIFDIISVSETDIRKALNLGLKDFEDAIQLVCAKKIKNYSNVIAPLEFIQKPSPGLTVFKRLNPLLSA